MLVVWVEIVLDYITTAPFPGEEFSSPLFVRLHPPCQLNFSMATHKWDDITEGDVWVVEPGLDAKDLGSGCCSSDTDSTVDTMETIDSKDVGSKDDAT